MAVVAYQKATDAPCSAFHLPEMIIAPIGSIHHLIFAPAAFVKILKPLIKRSFLKAMNIRSVGERKERRTGGANRRGGGAEERKAMHQRRKW